VKIKQYILLVLGLLLAGGLFAQSSTSGFPTSGTGTNSGFPQATQPKNTNKKGGLDDSTKVIYGPTSTKYFLEEDLFNNRKKLYTIDTTLAGFHNYNYLQRYGNVFQDLGNLATAVRPLYYQTPEQSGTMLGYSAYELYAIKPKDVRYYNTKSPFSNIYYVTGGGGQDILEFDFNRNVDSLWNVGLSLHRMTSTRQLVASTTSTSTENAIGHWEFMLHTNYQTKNKKYSLLAYINRFDHNIKDDGGVLTRGVSYDSLLRYSDNSAILANAASRDEWNNIHLYHEYVGYKAFQIFQVLDYQSRKTQFSDKAYSSSLDLGFYKKSYLATPTTTDSLYNGNTYQIFEHKSGIKGFYRGFNYRLHLRQRFFSYENLLNQYKISRNENFLGIWLNQYFKDSTRAFGELEYLVAGGYKFNFEFQGKWLRVGLFSVNSSPTLVQQYVYNNSFQWNNSGSTALSNVQSENIYATADSKLGNLVLSPSLNIQRIANYVYFDTAAVVKQASENILIYKAGLGISFHKGKFSTVNQIYLTTTSGPDLIRMPKIFINSRLAFDLLYAKVLFIQTGVELHYKSSYYGDAFMPAIQQFHLQDSQQLPGYMQADIFADMRINRVRVFFKLSHANHGFTGNGYYASPGFAGMGRTFGFGVRWLLFD
jgi:hypothetical protein